MADEILKYLKDNETPHETTNWKSSHLNNSTNFVQYLKGGYPFFVLQKISRIPKGLYPVFQRQHPVPVRSLHPHDE